MKTKVICKELKRGTLSFYAMVNGKEYFLFQQEFNNACLFADVYLPEEPNRLSSSRPYAV